MWVYEWIIGDYSFRLLLPFLFLFESLLTDSFGKALKKWVAKNKIQLMY